jgi:hypothetical protein
MKETILGLLIAIAAIPAIVMGTFLSICVMLYPIGAASCYEYAKVTGRDTTYKFLNGCYVKNSNGQFVPEEEFNYRAITNEVK